MRKIYQKPETLEEVFVEAESDMLTGSPELSETSASSDAENLSRFMLIDIVLFD